MWSYVNLQCRWVLFFEKLKWVSKASLKLCCSSEYFGKKELQLLCNKIKHERPEFVTVTKKAGQI